MTKQLQVGSSSSKEYYETVLRSKLRDILVEKVSLETGIDRDRTRDLLNSRLHGPSLLRDEELYMLLYGDVPAPGPGRLTDLERTVRRIGDWKP